MKAFAKYLVLLLPMLPSALAQGQLTTIYNFAGTLDGASPVDQLVFDKAGNLYGTTDWGGVYGRGTIFELSPAGNGSWGESVLYSFCQSSGCPDGSNPLAALVFDTEGNLYGTTREGGGPKCPATSEGCGTVFELMHPLSPGGAWIEFVLYEFCQIPGDDNCLDGAQPNGSLILDAAGNLYGTGSSGGAAGGGGVAFELSIGSNGWAETILYSFCSQQNCQDGLAPVAALTFDKQNNLYGTTSDGGSSEHRGGGVVFELIPSSSGWTEKVLYAFQNDTGPYGGGLFGDVALDSSGNVYSTANSGGANRVGTVFRVTPQGSLQKLSFNNTNGSYPTAGVLIDPRNGAVYGTTSGAGVTFGTVFEVVGTKITVLSQTAEAIGGLVSDKAGQHLYGTATDGGDSNVGTIFEVGR